MIAKANSLSIGLAALGTSFKLQRSAAIVAEFSRSGGLAAGGTDHRFALQLAVPYNGTLGGFLNVAAHGFSPPLGNRHLLTGSTIGT